VYGALLVEVDADGEWWCRQLAPSKAGVLHDLTWRVSGEDVSEEPASALVWGDIHLCTLDRQVADWTWGSGGLLDTLAPDVQVVHDLVDFRSRSHHDARRPHRQFVKWLRGPDDVRAEIEEAGRFLSAIDREWCETVVVPSNHHDHIGRWLEETDARKDPKNAEYWCALQYRVYCALRETGTVIYLKEALAAAGYGEDRLPRVRFLRVDEQYRVCTHAIAGGIELGAHGHLGPSGARGTSRNLSQMGTRYVKGHSHAAAIVDGLYSVGTCGSLSPDWLQGPSSWSHSHCVVYRTGRRAILTLRDGRWRAC